MQPRRSAPPRGAVQRNAGVGGLLREKRGPLPVWAWLLILIGVLLLVILWRRRNAAAVPPEAELPGDQYPPPVYVVPPASPPVVNVQLPPPLPPPQTPPPVPPGGGRDTPPGSGPGITVEVLHRYTSQNPPWDSTIWGIWNRYRNQHGADRTTAATWQQLWNAPQNAGLRALRGSPQGIRLHDRVFVPGVRAP